MKRFLVILSIPLLLSVPALAAKPAKGGGTSTPTGNDVSYPQCGKPLPKGQAFGIVGVNGGMANNTNGCLAAQWSWAQSSSGAAGQPPAQLYVNTGNPGDYMVQNPGTVTDWPSTSDPTVDPYGTCAGGNDQACAWEYGYERAQSDQNYLLSQTNQTGAGLNIWLDVETANSWDADTANNQADLEGMVYYFKQIAGANAVGVYAGTSAWQSITGTIGSGSNLYALASWIPGAATLSGAQANCQSKASLTPAGRVAITQYTSSRYDYDYSCP